ncbi:MULTISPECIES: hypothetical protein [Bhargavaea]|uniref:Uncharacterized protein n=1 Tax=Bhargavaea changchunensis TaxID=2134037 RepID=A0ABW2NEC5_9BACL|nr:hypothetical protein [Bhargavaea sp. CC-171006]
MKQQDRTTEVMMFSYELLRLHRDRTRCRDKEIQAKIMEDIKFLKQALKEWVA